MIEPNTARVNRWYFPGIAASVATCITHPLDLIKIAMETEQVFEKASAVRYARYIVRAEGMAGLYWGLQGKIRQNFVTVSARFGIYDNLKDLKYFENFPHSWNVCAAGIAGILGGFIKTPFELINTRILYDLKLPPHKRRNYHTLWKAVRFFGLLYGYKNLFAGARLTIVRTTLINICQLCAYSEAKDAAIKAGYRDNFLTHISASIITGVFTTILCQPCEVLRTRYVTATDAFNFGLWKVVSDQIALGFLGFYRGSMLTFVKIGPNTVTTFVLMEHLRLNYGAIASTPPPPVEDNSSSHLQYWVGKKHK